MTIKKPSFPTVSPQQFTKPIDTLIDKVTDLKRPDGSVDVKELKKAVEGDGLASQSLRVALDQFDVTVPASAGKPPAELNPRQVYPGCSGVVTSYRVDPTTLDDHQVSNVMSLLMKVKSQAEKIDANNDGVVSQAEYASAAQSSVVGSGAYPDKRILHSLVTGASPEIVNFMQADSAYRSAKANAEMRPKIAGQIRERAEHHAETPDGADALTWAYNKVLVDRPQQRTEISLDMAAQAAETSLARFLPFSNVKRRKGHLSDKEVRAMLNVPTGQTLRGYADEMKAKVTGSVGGDWNAFLAGSDVE